MPGAGVHALRRELEHPNRAAPHAVTPPAEHHGVDPPRKNPSQEHLALLLMEGPADEEMHRARRMYRLFADKAKGSQLRICETRSGRVDLVDLVDLGGQDEVVLGQAAGRVGRQVDA